MRGQLKTLTLSAINFESMSGSEIIKHIEKKYKWKPSPGSIYPKLEEIESQNLAKVKKEKNKKIYTITLKGKEELKSLSNKKEELIKTLSKAHNMMQDIYGLETGIDQKFLDQIRYDNLPIKDIEKESNEMKKETLRILTHKKYDELKKYLKNILKKANQDLKKLK